MTRSIARARAGRERASLYQEITDKIIAELEAGRVPWVQPWGTAAAKASLTMPKNAATHRHYSGLNVLILWGAAIERRFSTQNWLTFRQALGLGGNVRKGEHGTTVVYADHFVPDEESKRAERDGDEPSAIRFVEGRRSAEGSVVEILARFGPTSRFVHERHALRTVSEGSRHHAHLFMGRAARRTVAPTSTRNSSELRIWGSGARISSVAPSNLLR